MDERDAAELEPPMTAEPVDLDALDRLLREAARGWEQTYEGDIINDTGDWIAHFEFHEDSALTVAAVTALPSLIARVRVAEGARALAVGLAEIAEARIAALEAAARAVVDAASFSLNDFPLLCRICAAPDGGHSQSCPVGKLAALLEEGA